MLFAESLSIEEKIELLGSLNGNSSVDYLNELFSDPVQVNFETTVAEIYDKYQIADSYNLYVRNIEEYVTEKEFENIYKELISLNFLSEEKL
jgi:hypothetical protein